MSKRNKSGNTNVFEFHKWKKELLVFDKAIAIIIFLLLCIFKKDILIISVFFLLIPYLFLTHRKNALTHLYVALIVSIIWLLISNNQYKYAHETIKILGVHAFPLFAWASGLFAAYIFYSHWEHKLKFESNLKKMFLFIAIYWPLLIFVESIAYHLFNLVNLAAATYSGLPICNCIHAPVWMQISYFLLGPIYLGICLLLRLENPHHKKKVN